MAEWLKATDCKSVLSRVRRFESFSAHFFWFYVSCFQQALFEGALKHLALIPKDFFSCGSSSVGRATAFQAVGRGFEPRLPLIYKMAEYFVALPQMKLISIG